MAGASIISPLSIIDVIDDPALLGKWYAGDSWAAWRAIFKASYGLRMTNSEKRVFRRLAQRDPPVGGSKETVIIAGRRGGKDSATAAAITHSAVFVDHRPHLRPGERATCLVLAVDKSQSRHLLDLIRGIFSEVPMLQALVTRETKDGVELSTGAEIIVAPNSFRSIRGKTLASVVMNEVAFWRGEDGAVPDVETYRAVTPAMVTLPTSKLWMISSPYRKSGLLYSRHAQHFGRDDSDVLVIQAASIDLHPTLDRKQIERDYLEDPEVAKAEWGGLFRDAASVYIPRELVDSAVERGVVVRPRIPGAQHFCFVDNATGTGSGDSFCAAIAHASGEVVVLDALFERSGKFVPQAVAGEVSDLAKSFGVLSVTGDHYSAGWVKSAFAAHGIEYVASRADRSGIYGEAVVLFTGGMALLLDNQKLVNQIAQLERIPSPSGRDRVDHPRGAHDDLANAALGALTLAARRDPTDGEVFPIYIAEEPLGQRYEESLRGYPTPFAGDLAGPADDRYLRGTVEWTALKARGRV
jgi:hypothetical protein